MKKITILIISFLLLILQGCRPEEVNLGESEIKTDSTLRTDLDDWLENVFTIPFNINISYKWNENVIDFERALTPPNPENVKLAGEAINSIWLQSYSQVAGEDFIKKIAPRELVFIGSNDVNESGSLTFGSAEAGARVVLFRVDELDFESKSDVVRFLATVQHEYTHILNQTVPFDEQTYQSITPSGYRPNWNQISTTNAREIGFITNYSTLNPNEDFAEMVEAILSNSKVEYDAIIDGITSDEAKQNLRRKETLIVNYFKREFDLDLYELQRVTAENVEQFIN